MMKNEIGNMTDQIPLGKQLKYALQEKEALQEMVKESTYEYFRMLDLEFSYTGILLKREQLLELTADLNRASEEVSELELIIFEAGAAEELVLLATEHEWMNTMDQAYEEGYFSEK
jgi:hypothetical protein